MQTSFIRVARIILELLNLGASFEAVPTQRVNASYGLLSIRKGGDSDALIVLFLRLSGDSEEDLETPVRITGNWAEVRTEYLANVSPGLYR